MTEETHNAAVAGSWGIVMSIGVSAVLGWFLILALLFSIQDLETTISAESGQPVLQIFLDTVGQKGAIVLMVGSSSPHWIFLLTPARSSPLAQCSSAGMNGI